MFRAIDEITQEVIYTFRRTFTITNFFFELLEQGFLIRYQVGDFNPTQMNKIHIVLIMP